jgi:hypothetical protein
MEQINRQAAGDSALGKKVLSELLVADEPMTTGRLLDAVSRDVGWERTSNQAEIDKQIDRCVQSCRGLVSLVACDGGNEVVSVHSTFKQYLGRYGFSTEL